MTDSATILFIFDYLKWDISIFMFSFMFRLENCIRLSFACMFFDRW